MELKNMLIELTLLNKNTPLYINARYVVSVYPKYNHKTNTIDGSFVKADNRIYRVKETPKEVYYKVLFAIEGAEKDTDFMK